MIKKGKRFLKKYKDAISSFLQSIGLYSIKRNESSKSLNHKDYDLSEKEESEKINQHKEFLKSVLEQENSRLGYIENKTSQIISQTSIVFSLLSLFVPIIVDKFENENIYLKTLIIIILLLTFSFYLLAISNALKNFDLIKFKYPYSGSANVLNFKNNTLAEFNAELVRDFLYCIDRSIEINNEKATNLLHAYKSFKLGNLSTGIIVIFICSMLLFIKSEDYGVIIKKPIEIKNLDSLLNRNRVIVIMSNDTIKNRMKPAVQDLNIESNVKNSSNFKLK